MVSTCISGHQRQSEAISERRTRTPRSRGQRHTRRARRARRCARRSSRSASEGRGKAEVMQREKQREKQRRRQVRSHRAHIGCGRADEGGNQHALRCDLTVLILGAVAVAIPSLSHGARSSRRGSSRRSDGVTAALLAAALLSTALLSTALLSTRGTIWSAGGSFASQMQSDVIRCNQMQSEAIRCNQM